MNKKAESWFAVFALMGVMFAISKWVAHSQAAVAIPLFVLANYLAKRYSEELDAIGQRLSTFCCSIFRRKRYVYG